MWPLLKGSNPLLLLCISHLSGLQPWNRTNDLARPVVEQQGRTDDNRSEGSDDVHFLRSSSRVYAYLHASMHTCIQMRDIQTERSSACIL